MPHRFRIDRTRAMPVYVQLQEQIRLLIHRGALKPGDSMPTVRALAVDLGVNANTVSRVYRDLQSEGLLRLERGVGTFVNHPPAGEPITDRQYRRISRLTGDLVASSRDAGLTLRELVQLVGATWKESEE